MEFHYTSVYLGGFLSLVTSSNKIAKFCVKVLYYWILQNHYVFAVICTYLLAADNDELSYGLK